ncbi:hypothetical protein [Pseudomonas shirazensis]|uniref:hypothetical protein n=1 Tax=Pseudomonas shirazensis TaxID=2745494 RepID=UPI003D2DECA4
MNDAASSLLKVLSAFTSPKAAIKYICVALFILFSWSYVSTEVTSMHGPEQYVELISLFLGLGLGTLTGEAIYFLLHWIWEYGRLRYERSASEAIQKAASDAELIRQRDKESIFVQNFIKAYAHFSSFKVRVLDGLADEEVQWGEWHEEVVFMRDARYIIPVVRVTDESCIYSLNPLLRDFVKSKSIPYSEEPLEEALK